VPAGSLTGHDNLALVINWCDQIVSEVPMPRDTFSMCRVDCQDFGGPARGAENGVFANTIY